MVILDLFWQWGQKKIRRYPTRQ